jgi:hypothetical protein
MLIQVQQQNAELLQKEQVEIDELKSIYSASHQNKATQ